jgi:hypothetical protein
MRHRVGVAETGVEYDDQELPMNFFRFSSLIAPSRSA